MRLMVVDDSVQIRNGICRGIEWRKYGIDDIQACSNGKEALEKMRTFHPDIVVADIRMP